MPPPPSITVIQNDNGNGKEIGGSNHYCIICQALPPRSPPGKSTVSDLSDPGQNPLINSLNPVANCDLPATRSASMNLPSSISSFLADSLAFKL
ncbi:hypothetical protein PCANC_16287 [Puccinia coronata f. sp. avenae]|uniref:Uncharacterized protein n=1 Tax=Puccinia coronata f. sp. avenae TaxID=200324 RepID=A0A2N5UH87_9BASI|nr:hypothetical protein PCANC_16287 [Puccinia coronata f. sp. avenae]